MVERFRVEHVSSFSYGILLLLCSVFFSFFASSEIITYEGELNYAYVTPLVLVVFFGSLFGSVFSKDYILCSHKTLGCTFIMFKIVAYSAICAGAIYPLFSYSYSFTQGEQQGFGPALAVVLFWFYSSYIFIIITLPITLTLGIYITKKIDRAYEQSSP
jgi:hypothetical protein